MLRGDNSVSFIFKFIEHIYLVLECQFPGGHGLYMYVTCVVYMYLYVSISLSQLNTTCRILSLYWLHIFLSSPACVRVCMCVCVCVCVHAIYNS